MASSPARSSGTQLSYASVNQPWLKRWFINSVETVSGRDRYLALYDGWRRDVFPTADRPFGHMLDLIDLRLSGTDTWPPRHLPSGPLVVVANHPYGIGDGIAVLALAEQLGRPFRVLIHAELMKIREMERFSLPIDFSETPAAAKNNIHVRHEAQRLLREGTLIVVFPAGGVATATTPFGRATDLPWKLFPAKLIQEAQACVIPIFFAGQNGRLFHLVSQPMHLLDRSDRLSRQIGGVSLTLRTALLLREFTRLRGKTIEARIGEPIEWPVLRPLRDRRLLTQYLRRAVFDLGAASQAAMSYAPRLRPQAA